MPRDPLGPPAGSPPIGLDADARRTLRGWLLLAVGSLAIAGALALLLALSRTPVVGDWLPWPALDFFHRALVTHVTFAFVLWFLAMLGGVASAARPNGRFGLVGLSLATIGSVLILIPAFAGWGESSLNDYVPVIRDPLFVTGLGVFALGVLMPVLRLLIHPPAWGGPLAVGTGAAGLLYILALACFGLAWVSGPMHKGLAGFDEDFFWGGGHLLQFVYTAMLLTGWQILGAKAFGRMPLSPMMWRLTCGLLVLGALPGPFFYGMGGILDIRSAFTWLFRAALPIPSLIAGISIVVAIVKGPRDWRSPAFLALVLSLALFVEGGLFGIVSNGLDTRTPAHYHSEIGAVNLAFIGIIFGLLLPALLRAAGDRSVRIQLWLYGIGQGLFSVGMFVAGGEGVGRKIGGDAQGLDTLVKQGAMAVTGVGGAIAVAGGVVFVWMALRRLLVRAPG